jgi:hypothetical protein
MENLKELSNNEEISIHGGETLFEKYLNYIWDEMFPPEHDHSTCGMTPYPGGGHLIGTGVDR